MLGMLVWCSPLAIPRLMLVCDADEAYVAAWSSCVTFGCTTFWPLQAGPSVFCAGRWLLSHADPSIQSLQSESSMHIFTMVVAWPNEAIVSDAAVQQRGLWLTQGREQQCGGITESLRRAGRSPTVSLTMHASWRNADYSKDPRCRN